MIFPSVPAQVPAEVLLESDGLILTFSRESCYLSSQDRGGKPLVMDFRDTEPVEIAATSLEKLEKKD